MLLKDASFELYSMLREFVNKDDRPIHSDESGNAVCMYCGGDWIDRTHVYSPNPVAPYLDHSNDCIYPRAEKLLDSIVKGERP